MAGSLVETQKNTQSEKPTAEREWKVQKVEPRRSGWNCKMRDIFIKPVLIFDVEVENRKQPEVKVQRKNAIEFKDEEHEKILQYENKKNANLKFEFVQLFSLFMFNDTYKGGGGRTCSTSSATYLLWRNLALSLNLISYFVCKYRILNCWRLQLKSCRSVNSSPKDS